MYIYFMTQKFHLYLFKRNQNIQAQKKKINKTCTQMFITVLCKSPLFLEGQRQWQLHSFFAPNVVPNNNKQEEKIKFYTKLCPQHQPK